MTILRLKALLGAGCFSLALIGTAMNPAHAGGLERGGYDIDLLFDPAPFATEAEATYVMPDRKYENARGPGGADLGLGTSADGAEGYWVPRVGMKVQVVQGVDCMVDYSQPWGAHTAPGMWNGALSNTETDIKSNNYAGTCSYKFDAGKGQLRFIGGLFYQDISGFKESLVNVLPALTGRVDLEASGWGWRAGVAYEIPDIALRASLVYNSKVKLDNISGALDLTSIGRGVTDIYGSTQYMPDSVELKLQSGIAPGWLAFGSIKWVNWSLLQSVPICPVGAPSSLCFTNGPAEATSLDLMYRDGWTVSGGIGHKFNDQWSGAGQLTWDRGTSHGFGAQTDTWTLGGGVAYTPKPNIEVRLAGAVGVLTSGHSGIVIGENGKIIGDDATYDFGNDLVTAFSGGIKIKF
ncbi:MULTISPECIES: OmpP1/FadL family transporter [Mesorhizobium]|uniref:Membrane protein involved in aromatic hydrocarbon degradation n=2 Tax=Mesorhizobium TaxID=68287 RepID=E8TKA3_MESCW|nr:MULTISPECIES: OmpP1/FadL family transporter [Mesorhizobium]ADV12602.1 membrane protein involved in aromatic hydrocarbon degradation [Mesorhizobium ciceri biovar biserrulae WSM1271]AMX93247.1 long-chain fatty acid transporter [Mesorhizobium ciceri]MDF3207914.1 OmpP1/FadL family transporter [Mesorhizobium sp. LMG15046]MDF3229514.1 OmpP1/FadL family transporter [Mesorhizobium sp. DSM 30133]RUU22607.1 transporter [Mesorhizobium sp. Primo-B]